MRTITTAGLDDIARDGLPKLRNCVAGVASKDDMISAELTLKLLRLSTAMRNSEINEVGLNLKIARAGGLTPQEIRAAVWEPLARRASGEVPGKSPAALEAPAA